jgi:hypothetical protein
LFFCSTKKKTNLFFKISTKKSGFFVRLHYLPWVLDLPTGNQNLGAKPHDAEVMSEPRGESNGTELQECVVATFTWRPPVFHSRCQTQWLESETDLQKG